MLQANGRKSGGNPGDLAERTATAILAGLDGRTVEARNYRATVEALTEHLPENSPATMLTLAGRAAALMILVNRAEEAILAGEPIDHSQHMAALNVLRRYLNDLGLRPGPGNDAIDVAEVLAGIRRTETIEGEAS